MRPPSSSSSSSPLLLLLLLLLPRPAAADVPDCVASFRAGHESFVLDAEDAVKEGASVVATAHVRSAEDCQLECCADMRCNVALLEKRAGVNLTCVTFNCVHRNRFVCRFVNQVGYWSYIRESVFQKYLRGPKGTGDDAPPIAIAGDDVITQPGKTVTLNGIESLALGNAQITDYKWTLQSGDDDVKMEETGNADQVQLSHLQPGSFLFQLTVTDSNGQSHAAKVTVLVLSPEQSSLFCRAPLKVGPCRAAFPRWRYDAQTGDCETFVFGGCKANNNNFLSKEECVSACSGVTVSSERGGAPPGKVCVSPCVLNQMLCDGCCLDRSLECDGVKQCSDGSDEEQCSKLNQTFNRLLDIDVNERKARCAEAPHTGPCRASFTRWYYSPMDRKCSRFTYGGCEANGNNFDEENTCRETCDGVTESSVFFRGMFDRFETEDESDSGNIALAVLLSVAILALLAILTYCFLKSRKNRSLSSASSGPAHTALPQQEPPVYNTTTKPV